MNLKQKQLVSTYFPELGELVAQREKSGASSALDALALAIVNKIETLKGERGDDGTTPVKGKDYFTNKEIDEIIEFVRDSSIPEEILRKATPVKGKHYRDGIDGRNGRDGKDGERGPTGRDGRDGIGINGLNGSPDSPKDIANKLNTLKGVLNPSVLGGLNKEFERINKKVESGMAVVNGRIKLLDQRWHGSGLSRVTTDSTLSGLGTSASPLHVVSGGTGSGYQAPLTGGLTGTNTWTTAPSVLVVDGIPMQKVRTDGTVNWTGTTTTVLTVAPSFDVFATA